MNYGIVGNGRLATHLTHYFKLLHIPYCQWSRGDESKGGITPADALSSADVILVLIRDSEIDPFIVSHPRLKQKILIQCSGSLVSDSAYGCHPLMLFGPDLYPLETYKRIPFIIEEGAPGFKEVFPQLDNAHFTIKRELKPLYHALCVMSGNFTTLLWQKCFADFSAKLNIPHQASIPYLEQVVENLKQNYKEALTGPIARKDHQTIEKNLAALEKDECKEIYEAFVRVFLPDYRPNAR